MTAPWTLERAPGPSTSTPVALARGRRGRRPSRVALAVIGALLAAGFVVAVGAARARVERAAATADWHADDGSGVAWLIGRYGGEPTWTCERRPTEVVCDHEGHARYGAYFAPGPRDEQAARAGLDLGEGIIVQFDPGRWACGSPVRGERPTEIGFSCARV